MIHDLNRNVVFKLKKEIEALAPNNFNAVREFITKQIANELIKDLDGIPSFEGRLISEKREKFINEITKKGA